MRYHERVAQAFAETIIPRGGPFALGGADIPIAPQLATMTTRMGYLSGPLRLLLVLLDWLPVLFFSGFRKFTRMSPDRRHAFISKLATSRWLIPQTAFYGIKALVVTVFYSSAEAGAAIGYPGVSSRDPVSREPVIPT